MTYTLTTDHTAAVSNDYHWLPITSDTPRGVKLLLLGAGGVAHMGQFDADPFWVGWFPLPRRAPCSTLS